ncbi:unnamed protein product [Ilex paraguariensis]|uniref:Uncharacterized protein n=1 Tax=Ilex paraguariensis TaxID=185542 RepID=A0ABC8V0Z4_9AQUA
MIIPPLKVVDSTEWFFRNMIAYEQYKQGTAPTYMTDYMIFVCRLLDSPKDVKILCNCGVIDNWLGDGTTVSNMFNKMTNYVNITFEKFCYPKVFNEVNTHCEHPWHTWMANLKHNYFNNPWSIISVIGAFVLLVLTVIQTIWHALLRDLLLFENQLPPDNIVDLALSCLAKWVPYFGNLPPSKIPPNNVDHQLGLLHDTWCSSFVEIVYSPGNVYASHGSKWSFIKYAIELRQAGIKFKKATGSVHLFEIKFVKGIMIIPPLKVVDSTEWFFRNMIAYEQYKQGTAPTYMTDYMIFVCRLLDSPKDVKILCNCGVIDNWLGDGTTVSNMFNKMTNYVNITFEKFCYPKVFNEVNTHCEHPWHTWMANLKHNYFNNPWSIISVIGAFVLLVLTVIQTVCSILQV